MHTINVDKIKELRRSVITIVCNAFASCETLKSVEEAEQAANSRVIKGLTKMADSGVFSKNEIEQLSNFATNFIASTENETRQSVVKMLRDQFEF